VVFFLWGADEGWAVRLLQKAKNDVELCTRELKRRVVLRGGRWGGLVSVAICVLGGGGSGVAGGWGGVGLAGL